MARISLWSPVHGQGRTTVNTALLSFHIALTKQLAVLALDSQFTYGRLQDIISPYAEDGMSAIFTYAHTNNLTPDIFKTYATSIIEKKLYILGVTKQKIVYEEIWKCYEDILTCAAECFDLVLVDTNAGTQSNDTDQILRHSDLVVACLPQEDYILNKFFAKDPVYWHPALDNKPYVCVLSDYNKELDHYSETRVRRKFGLKELYTIPTDKYLHKAINQHNFANWFIRNYDADKKDPSYSFFDSISKLSDRLLAVPKRKGIFSRLKAQILEKKESGVE